MTNNKEMLADLDIDEKLYHELNEAQNEIFHKTFPSQKSRPEGMKNFDALYYKSHDGRISDLYEKKRSGKKIVGTFCIYIPEEIGIALGVELVPLCGGSGWSVSYADKMLPRDICPLVRSTFGMALSKTCPFKKLKEHAIGETTCDAKKKAWDLFGVKVLEVPQKKNPEDFELWFKETLRFTEMMEELSGNKIDDSNLASAIKLVNKRRILLHKINSFRRLTNPPISGLDCLLISQIALASDINEFNNAAEELISELEKRACAGVCVYPNTKRVLIAGCPSPLGYSKIHSIVEKCRLYIAADESCTGTRYYRDLTDERGKNPQEMLRAIAERYFKIDCSCFTPNKERIANITEIIKEFNIDAVVHNILQYCHTYNIEAKIIDNSLKKMNIPSIKIETDYSEEDREQIFTRIEAFKEMITA